MADGKSRRQRAIADLIRTASIGSQEALAARLAEAGFQVTQATVSRDLDELGAVKLRRPTGTVYALPEVVGAADWAGRRLETILGEWARSIACAGNLIVIRTPPGSAHLVGVAIDQAQLSDVVGTICGDDTIFIAVADAARAERLAAELNARISGGEAPQAPPARPDRQHRRAS